MDEKLDYKINEIKRKIEQIFIEINNKFCEKKFTKTEDVYNVLEFLKFSTLQSDVKLETFVGIYEEYIGMEYIEDFNEDILRKYENLFSNLKELLIN